MSHGGEVVVVGPHGPHDAGQLVGQCHGRFVVPDALIEAQRPGSQPIGRLQAVLADCGEHIPQGIGHSRVGIFNQGPDARHDVMGADGNDETELVQQATQGVDVGGALGQPRRAQPRCSAASVCCSTDFTGTGRISALR